MVRSCSRDNVPVVSYVFFFSSRRRHTRFDCDWSSDVCSSDLFAGIGWLEGVLQSAGFACVVVSHDRYFLEDRKSTRLNSSHSQISYAVFCLKKKTPISPLSGSPHSRTLSGAASTSHTSSRTTA